ncbi:MAG: hypothetical protein ABR563_19710 [Pyrinomonadaceae bacterium]
MSTPRANTEEADASRKKIFIVVGLLGALVVALLVYCATRPAPPAVAPRLENAIRADSPEFANWRDRVAIDYIVDNDTLDSVSALGGRTITPQPTIRNFTGRTISGLELKATVVDLDGKPARERTMIVIPNSFNGLTELAPNKFTKVTIPIEGFKKEDVAANVKIEMTAVRFK